MRDIQTINGGLCIMIDKEDGKILKILRAGGTVQCPECKKGKVTHKGNNLHHFSCDKCDFKNNID